MDGRAGSPGVIGRGADEARGSDGPVEEPTAPDVVVVTDRLVVRVFTPADLADLVALHADPVVMHFITNGASVDPLDVADALEGWIDRARCDLDAGCWAADERRSGRFLGWFHLFRDRPREPHTLELGYRLHRDAWGVGLASEGARALVDRAFATTDVRRVRAETMAVHTASRRVMENCGMRLVRIFDADWPVRIPGDEHGDVEYALDRPVGLPGA